MDNLLIALVLGLVFGFLLNKAGLTSYHKIVNVFRLTDMAVLAGAAAFGLTYETVFPQISRLAAFGNVTLGQLWNVNSWLLIGVFAVMSLFLFYLIDHGLIRKDRLTSAE